MLRFIPLRIRFFVKYLKPSLFLATLILTLASPSLKAQSNPIGLWQTFDEDSTEIRSIVEIELQNNHLIGTIKKILDPKASADERCEKCSGLLKNKPILGLTIIQALNPQPKGGEWSGGTILDPEDGKQYKLTLELDPLGKQLKVRGHWGFFYKTQIWKRVP